MGSRLRTRTRLRAKAAGGGPSYDADAQAYFTVAGVTQEPYLSGYNQFFLDLKAANILTKFDRLWILANQTSAAALTCLVSLNQDAAVAGTPTFTAGQGYTGNGTNGYINTGYNASTDGAQFTQNDASYGCYANLDTNEARQVMGGFVSPNGCTLAQRYSGTQSELRINSQQFAFTVSSGNGLLLLNRTAADAAGYYQDNSTKGTTTSASAALGNVVQFLLCFSNNGSPSGYSTNQLSLAWYGASMDSTERTAFYDAVTTLKAAIGW